MPSLHSRTPPAAGQPIYVSAHSLVELVYAVEKATNPITEDDRQAILGELAREDSPFEVVPVTGEIAIHVAEVPRVPNADPADRIIVATAEVLGLTLVSSDRHIPTMTTTAVVW